MVSPVSVLAADADVRGVGGQAGRRASGAREPPAAELFAGAIVRDVDAAAGLDAAGRAGTIVSVRPAICGPVAPPQCNLVAASAVVRRREARRGPAGRLAGTGVLRRLTVARTRLNAAALVLSRPAVRRRVTRANMSGVLRATRRRALRTFAGALVRRRAAGAGTRNSHESAFRVGVAHAYVVVAAACDGTVPGLARLEAGASMGADVARVTMLGEPRFARQRPVALRQHSACA